jgi:hypothetical protein
VPREGWSIDIDDWADEAIELAQEVTAEAFLVLSSNITLSTPVFEAQESWEDSGGRLRASGSISGSTPSNYSAPKNGAYSDSSTLSRLAAELVLVQGDTFTLTFNLAYAAVVEFGGFPFKASTGRTTPDDYSTQAPGGFIRPNVLRWSNLVNEEARKRGDS